MIKSSILLQKSVFLLISIKIGAETWGWSKNDQSRMQAAEMKFLCSIEKVTKRDMTRNKINRQQVGVQSMEEIRKRGLE
jgi:hypothetical protein